MIIKKILLISLTFSINFFILAENIINTNTVKINTITFEGIKTTSPKYLLSLITIKEGSIWNETAKAETLSKLLKQKTIIENVEIMEEKIDTNKVNIIIKILEKSAYIVVPFFTYSNSKGIMPKLIFRHYNLGGYRKYLNTKLEFLPKDSLNLYLLFKDPAVLNNSNLSYELTGEFKTSIINYYINRDNNGNSRGLAPFGAIQGDTKKRWSDDLFYLGNLKFKLKYNIPKYDVSIRPEASIQYKSIRTKDFYEDEKKKKDKEQLKREFPIDIISPKIRLRLVVPIKKIDAYFKPDFIFNYDLNLGDMDQGRIDDNKYYSHGSYNIYIYPSVKFSFTIPVLDFKLYPRLGFYYSRYAAFDFKQDGSIGYSSTLPFETFAIVLGLDFTKAFFFRNTIHQFNINAEYTQLFTSAIYMPNIDFKAKFDFYYYFNYYFLNMHRIYMRWNFYSNYNTVRNSNKYKIGDDPGEYKGWVGLIANLKYELPLFLVDTTKLATIKMKRPLIWQVYWDFYIDMGLSLADQDYGVYTFDYNYLHIYPALGVGTSIRILPKFVPVNIVLDVGFDVYKILREKNISGGSLIISFHIDDLI